MDARRVADEAGEVDDKILACFVGPGKDLGFLLQCREKPLKRSVPADDMI